MDISEDDLRQFKKSFEEILVDIQNDPCIQNVPGASSWLCELLRYNILDGKHICAKVFLLASFRLTPEMTPEHKKRVLMMGWLLEMVACVIIYGWSCVMQIFVTMEYSSMSSYPIPEDRCDSIRIVEDEARFDVKMYTALYAFYCLLDTMGALLMTFSARECKVPQRYGVWLAHQIVLTLCIIQHAAVLAFLRQFYDDVAFDHVFLFLWKLTTIVLVSMLYHYSLENLDQKNSKCSKTEAEDEKPTAIPDVQRPLENPGSNADCPQQSSVVRTSWLGTKNPVIYIKVETSATQEDHRNEEVLVKEMKQATPGDQHDLFAVPECDEELRRTEQLAGSICNADSSESTTSNENNEESKEATEGQSSPDLVSEPAVPAEEESVMQQESTKLTQQSSADRYEYNEAENYPPLYPAQNPGKNEEKSNTCNQQIEENKILTASICDLVPKITAETPQKSKQDKNLEEDQQCSAEDGVPSNACGKKISPTVMNQDSRTGEDEIGKLPADMLSLFHQYAPGQTKPEKNIDTVLEHA